MAFDPATFTAIMAALSAAGSSGLLSPNQTVQQAAPPAGGAPQAGQGLGPLENLFAQMSGPQALPGAAGTNFASSLALPPTPPAPQITQAPTSAQNPQPAQGAGQDGAPETEIGDILAALPEAIAVASELLGLNQQQQVRPAPTAGSASNPGQLVQGFGLPQGMSLGDLLAALPRMR